MTKPDTDVAGLVAELRESAQRHSEASKMMADAKTARQTDRDDHPEMTALGMGGYDYLKPEQTLEWRAAAALTSTAQAAEMAREAGIEAVLTGVEEIAGGPWRGHKGGYQVTVSFSDKDAGGKFFHRVKQAAFAHADAAIRNLSRPGEQG